MYEKLTDKELLNILCSTSLGTAVYATEKLVIQTANPEMLKFWDKDSSVLEKSLLDIFEASEGGYVESKAHRLFLENVWKTGKDYNFKKVEKILEVNGHQKVQYFDVSYKPFIDTRGKVYAVLHTALDVTELYLLQLTTEETAGSPQQNLLSLHELGERKFKRMVNQAPVGISILRGKEFIIECANKLMFELLDKSDEIIELPIQSALPGIYDQGFIHLLTEVYSTGVSYTGHEAKVQLDFEGKLREYYLDFIFEPFKNNEGATTSIMVVVTDVTCYVLARIKFQKDQEFLRFSVMAAGIGTWSLDLKTEVATVSLKGKELFGFLEEDQVGPEQIMSQVTPEFKEKVFLELNKVMAEGGICDITYSILGFHDQKLRWIRTIAGVINDENGMPSYKAGISIETTQQKQDELRKNQFISIVSHELKTPLTAIKGYIELIKHQSDKLGNSFISKTLVKTNSRVDKMTTIINGFLNVSQLEIGKIQLVNQTFILEELIREVSDEANMFRNEKRVKFRREGSTPVIADRDKIEQVITNLISNADKYSAAGSNIFIECLHDEDRVTIKVKDNGKGIHPENHTRIFEKYFRVESQENKLISGFGIGLYLCKEIIDRHNGQLWVESLPDKGSEFIFYLPLN